VDASKTMLMTIRFFQHCLSELNLPRQPAAS
jgi:hypothetical protein